MSEQPLPRLVDAGGRSYDVAPGRSTLGRHPDAGITLDHHTVGRRHAEVVAVGGQVVITDLQSTNGTFVNDTRLDARDAIALRDGDVVRLGDLALRFVVSLPPPTAGTSYGFGDVGGSVQTGSGTQHNVGRDQYQSAGDQHNVHGDEYRAGRDMYHDRRVRVNADYDPSDEFALGRGFPRFLLIIGTLIALTGFGMFAYTIFTAFVDDDPFEGPTPFELELVAGVPMFAAGFVLFAAGGVLAGIGSTMSKARRKREEDRQWNTPMGGWTDRHR